MQSKHWDIDLTLLESQLFDNDCASNSSSNYHIKGPQSFFKRSAAFASVKVFALNQAGMLITVHVCNVCTGKLQLITS